MEKLMAGPMVLGKDEYSAVQMVALLVGKKVQLKDLSWA